MYPISDLITTGLTRSGMTRPDLVRAVGFTNLTKGLRRLDACLAEGDCTNSVLLRGLARTLGIDQGAVDEAVRLTRAQLAAESEEEMARASMAAREYFKPHVYVVTSRNKPSFLAGAALFGRQLKYLPVAENTPMDDVSAMVRQHYIEMHGRCPFFGEITGYIYFQIIEIGHVMRTDGAIIDLVDHYQLGSARLRLTIRHSQLNVRI
jgi:hypothetical protein